MGGKLKRKIICIFLVVVILCASGYVYKKSENAQTAQEKVVNEFVSNFYKVSKLELVDDSVKSLLAPQYNLSEYNFEQISVNSDNPEQINAGYNDYSIVKVSKEKVNCKKVVVYFVDVNFNNKEQDKSIKRLYIELVNENSQWKINNIIPRSI